MVLKVCYFVSFFYLSRFNHIELYNLPVSYTAKEFSRIVFLNGSLKKNYKWNKYSECFVFFKQPLYIK